MTDPAIVNVPLAKRGNIDAQLAAYVATQRRNDALRIKAARKAHRDRYEQAKALIARVPDARMAELGRPHGLTPSATRKQFVSIARSNPDRVIATMTKEIAG